MATVGTPAEAAGRKKKDWCLRIFELEEDVAVALAKYVAELSEKCASKRGVFTVVLSGGYLIDCLRKLVEAPYVDSVDWAKWHVFWLDERVVPKTDKDSNYKLAYDGFLSKVPIPPDHVYPIDDNYDPIHPAEVAAEKYEACLKQVVETGVLEFSAATGFPRFDLMLLGMGPDGHVASLFPGHPQLHENKRWVTFINDSPKPPPVRITFTFPIINSSAYIALVVVGPNEADAVRRALESNETPLLPVQMVKLEDGEFTWFTDKEATSKLRGCNNL